MTIKEMIEKRAKVWETAKNFVDTHENENGVLSAEDNATYSRMEQEIEDLTAAIDRQQRAEAREAEFNKPVNMPLTGRPARQEVEEKTGRASNAYKEDFGAHLRGKRLVHNVLSEGVQADGGYLVPEEFERQIVSGLDLIGIHDGFLHFSQHVDRLLHLRCIAKSDSRGIVDHHHAHRTHEHLRPCHRNHACRRCRNAIDLHRDIALIVHQHVVDLSRRHAVTARTVDPDRDVPCPCIQLISKKSRCDIIVKPALFCYGSVKEKHSFIDLFA